MKKLVNPTAHGVIDYVFSGLQLAGPRLFGLNTAASRTYQALGTGFTIINALTDTPVGIRHLIPFKGHQKADLAFLTGMGLFTLTSFIRKDKKALAFHLGFHALALANYLLTDYDEKL